MTTSTIRFLSLLTLTLGFASFARALPASSGSATFGLPDLDVVRNPYSSLILSSSFLGPNSSSIVGPSLGFSGGITPPLIFGGGGGFGGSPFASFAPPPVVFPSFQQTVVFPLNTPLNSLHTLQASTATLQVPEGGSTLVLFGSVLLSALALRKRLLRTKR